MRLLHISDWHLGATLGPIRREPDHQETLEETVQIAADFRPHLTIHTGDLFDGVRPPVDSMRLAFATLRRLSTFGPVVVVSGNHDSRALFRLFNQILSLTDEDSRVQFVADVVLPENGGVAEYAGDDGEVARLACLPFLHPNQLVDVFSTAPKGWTGKYADGVRALQDVYRNYFESDYDARKYINLYAAHLHVGGSSLAHSERVVHVSEDYAVDSESLPPVSYAAFGHIHKPQRLPGLVVGRYAGSPIQMDYGEEGEQKSVVTVDVRPGQAARVETIDLVGGRNLVRVEGTWEELAEAAKRHASPSILTATIVSDEPEKDPTPGIARLFPNADILNVFNRVTGQEKEPVAVAEGATEISFRDAFGDYVATAPGLGKRQSKRVLSLFGRLLDAVETEQDPQLAEESELSTATEIHDAT